MENKRKSPRMLRLKEGRIYFNGKKSMMSCIVRNASETGARVTVGEPRDRRIAAFLRDQE